MIPMIPDDNNAREIIRYFIDEQERVKYLRIISSHAQILKSIIFLRVQCNWKRGYFFSSRENTVIIFHLVSIVKYNNIIYVNVIIIHSDVRNPGPVSNIIYVNLIII